MNHQMRDANATGGDGAPPKGIFGKGIFGGKGRKPPFRSRGVEEHAKNRRKAPDAIPPGRGVISFDTGYMELPAFPAGESPAAAGLPLVAEGFSVDGFSRPAAIPRNTAPNVRIGPIRRLKHHVAALSGSALFLAGIGGGDGGPAGDAIAMPGLAGADVAAGDGMGITVCPVSFFHLHAPGRETGIGEVREADVYLMRGDAAEAGERSTLDFPMATHIRQEPPAPIRVPGHPARDGNGGGIVGSALSAFDTFPAVVTLREDALLLMASACHAIPRMKDGVSVRPSALPSPLAHRGAKPADLLLFPREALVSGDTPPDFSAISQGPNSFPPRRETACPATWASPAPSDGGAPVPITAVHKDLIDLAAQRPMSVVVPVGVPGDWGAPRLVGPEESRPAVGGRVDTGHGILRFLVIDAARNRPAEGAGKAIPPKTKASAGPRRLQPVTRIEVSVSEGSLAGSFGHCAITDRPIPATIPEPWTNFIAAPPGNTLLIPARAEILVGHGREVGKGAGYPESPPRKQDGISIRLPPLDRMPAANTRREPVAVSLEGTGGDDYVAQLVLAGQAKDQSLPDIVPLAFREVHAARALAIAPVSGKQGAGETLVLLAGIPARTSPALPGEASLLEKTLAIQGPSTATASATGAWGRAIPADDSRTPSPPPGAGTGKEETRKKPAPETAPPGVDKPAPTQETTDPSATLLLDPLRWAILQGAAPFGNPTWRFPSDATPSRTERSWRLADGDFCLPWAKLWAVLSVLAEPGPEENRTRES